MNSVEKEAVLHCLKAMIDEEVCEECPLYGTTGTDHCEKDCVRLAINALEQEPYEDAISRQVVLDMLENINAETEGVGFYYEHYVEYIKNLQSVTPQPCGDCISRETVENAIKHAEVNFTVNSDIDFTKHKREVHEIVNGIIDAQIKALRELPPVTPMPKMGKWIKDGKPWGGGQGWKCLECKERYNVPMSYTKMPYSYCPNCGAKIEVQNDNRSE